MKTTLVVCLMLFALAAYAQPTRIEVGMKRNTVQTVMGKAKIESYEKDKTVYIFADNVYFTVEFDADELSTGFFFSGKNEKAVEKVLLESGFVKTDSLSFGAKDFQGLMKNQNGNGEAIFRFVRSTDPGNPLKDNSTAEQEKEKPFYGFSILGMKVYERKEESH